MMEWIRALGLAVASGLLVFWLSAPLYEREVDSKTSVTASQPEDRGSSDRFRSAEDALAQRAVGRAPQRSLHAQRESHETFQKARERRDWLKDMAKNFELGESIRRGEEEAQRRGEHYLPPTIGNCARIVGAGKRTDCPLPFESPETLRHLAECDMLNFDIPWPVFAGSRERGGPPWEDLGLSQVQRRALEDVDRELHAKLYPLMQEAYRESFGREPPPGLTLEDFHVEEAPTDKTAISSAFGLAARVRLGEVPEAQIAELTPRARYYATLAISGDAYERSLAEILGNERARELRRRESGWGAQGVDGSGKCSQIDLPEEP